MYLSGKYDSARDELLHRMTLSEWANESTGDVEAPVGYFARMSNSPAEMMELTEAFADDIAELEVDTDTLIGHFLITSTSQGFVFVETYDSEYRLKRLYDALESEYAEWCGDGDES